MNEHNELYVGRFIVVQGDDYDDQLQIQKLLLAIYVVNSRAVMMVHETKVENIAARIWAAMGNRVEIFKANFGQYQKDAFRQRDVEMLSRRPELVIALKGPDPEKNKLVNFFLARTQKYDGLQVDVYSQN